MKWSDGFANTSATIGVFVGFGIGAALQTYAMRLESLGVGYVVVLGLEAVLAVLAGVLLFEETLAWRNVAGAALVIAGIVLMKSAPL